MICFPKNNKASDPSGTQAPSIVDAKQLEELSLQVETHEENTRFPKSNELRYYLRRLAYDFKLIQYLKSISREKYDEKISASLIYGFYLRLQWIFSFNRDIIYSSGATGLARRF